MSLKKVVSGGQTGADQGALYGAKRGGIATGGWMTKGFRTETGPRPEFRELFGMKETGSPLYPVRTAMNVKMAHGTLLISKNFDSAGSRCTLKAIDEYDSPHLKIQFSEIKTPSCLVYTEILHQILNFISKNKIEILNVAGNRESGCLGIQKAVEDLIYNVIKLGNVL